MRVIKFGGTSLSSPTRLSNALGIVREASGRGRVVVVTSALAGVTDLLVGLVDTDPMGERAFTDPSLDRIRDRHLALFHTLGTDPESFVAKLQSLLNEVGTCFPPRRNGESWLPEARDHLLSLGDRAASLLFASLLQEEGYDARAFKGGDVIRTDSTFGQAGVDRPGTLLLARRTLNRLPAGAIPVVAGFSGSDGGGRSTILGRGSSDLTASLLGEALSADTVEIWSDVDGVHDRDPRVDPAARLLNHLSYSEARSLAQNGAKVLHPACLDPLEEAGIPLIVRNTARPEVPGSIVATVTDASARRQKGTIVRLILAGATGGVGNAFLRQLRSVAPTLRSQGVEILISGAISSEGYLWDREGVGLDDVDGSRLEHRRPDWAALARQLAEAPPENPLFVDCTASREVAARYPDILLAGAPLVTPNKLAWSGPLEEYHRIRKAAGRWGLPYRYETTVGAALPILKTIRELKTGGDRFRSITGVLSGTLSFLFARLREGVRFSEAVREARDAGYTEPHPRDDLTGTDVARKLLILLREAGEEVEPEAIPVESLVPEALANEDDPDRFLDALPAHDGDWDRRFDEADGRPLAYVAWFDGIRAGVGVRPLAASHPLAGLRPTENMVVLETDRYPEVPLTIAGPGAGREVTASGVLSDFLSALHERYGSRRVA